jgi:hypothetical protein
MNFKLFYKSINGDKFYISILFWGFYSAIRDFRLDWSACHMASVDYSMLYS